VLYNQRLSQILKKLKRHPSSDNLDINLDYENALDNVSQSEAEGSIQA
jgi:hypothetical protein